MPHAHSSGVTGVRGWGFDKRRKEYRNVCEYNFSNLEMANVKVAVRVRPPSKKELDAGAINIVDVNEDILSITNLKINSTEGDRHRERVRNYSFDHCYNSVDRQADNYASQELIYQDLGTEVLNASFSGYNACLFAYGQTGSGKTYTVMGDEVDAGLIPRICEGMCSRVDDLEQGVTFKIEVSYLEIYNERVRDLLVPTNDTNYTLKVREHPKDGPYVQDLTKHMVSDFDSVMMLIMQGNRNRTTAATHMHEASSRSHAIFTLNFVQAKMVNSLPSEIVSKINLVDLAGSERANLNYHKGRLQEGANINKSLVTLGNCISALGMDAEDEEAENSMALSAASMESLALSEDGDISTPRRRPGFIPYRNSVLTWLLKDSLGGNSRTIMIATISPSSTYFNETMSTLRYARRAKRIINQPLINEDPNVRLIRELRAEIDRLKTLLNSASLSSSQASLVQDVTISKMLAENEQKVDQLTEAWVDKWREAARIMQECNVGIRRESMGVIVESELPHLIGMDDDLLSTGIILYHLMEGQTTIGREDSDIEQDIVLWGPGIECRHAEIVNHLGRVTLHPVGQAACAVNGNDIHEPTPLTQGAVVLFGKTNMFRFNHPAEAARLREKRASSIKPTDVEEIRRPRKNSVTLRVHNNVTAITEEGTRIRKISLSRETPPVSQDSLSLPRGRSLNNSPLPVPEVSSIMMYNPGVELERQHKIKVDKVERTRKRLEELQDKERRVEAAHKEEEERMKMAYEEHQRMIQEQRELLQRLREEHERVKQETEKELQEMRENLAREKEQGQKQLEEERQSLKRDQLRKASISASEGAAFPSVIAEDTEQSSDLSVLDVDLKRLTQMELMHLQSQRKAEAALERRQAAFDRQRSASMRLIEQEERRLHEIECIPSLSDRFASASNDSLDSSPRSEGDTSNGIGCWSGKDEETGAVIGWGRVSPIGGRSDSDSASSKAASHSSDKEETGLDSQTAETVTPPRSLNVTGSGDSLPHRTTKPTPSKSQRASSAPNKPQEAASPVKPKSTHDSVFSRLYRQQTPKFEYLRRKPQRSYAEGKSPRQRTEHSPLELPKRQRSLTDGAVDIRARSERLTAKPLHSKPQGVESKTPATRSKSRDSLNAKSEPRAKNVNPRLLPERGQQSKNFTAKRRQETLKESPSSSLSKNISRNSPKPQSPHQRDCKSPAKSPKSNAKPETKVSTIGELKSPVTQPVKPRRTKFPSSESAIEKALKRKPNERPKPGVAKDGPQSVVQKDKSSPKEKDRESSDRPRIIKPIAKAVEKFTSKRTAHAEAFFVTVGEEVVSANGEKGSDSTSVNDTCDAFQEDEQISLERQPAIGCSESMEDVGSVGQSNRAVSLSLAPNPIGGLNSDTNLDDSFSKEVEEILSDSNESYPDSLEDLEEQEPSYECRPDSPDDGGKHLEDPTSHIQSWDSSPRHRKRGVSMEMEDFCFKRSPEGVELHEADKDTQPTLQDHFEDSAFKDPQDQEAITEPAQIPFQESRSEASMHPDEQTLNWHISDHSHGSILDNEVDARGFAYPVDEECINHPLLLDPTEIPSRTCDGCLLESEELHKERAVVDEEDNVKEIKSRPDEDVVLACWKAPTEMAVVEPIDGIGMPSEHVTSDPDDTLTNAITQQTPLEESPAPSPGAGAELLKGPQQMQHGECEDAPSAVEEYVMMEEEDSSRRQNGDVDSQTGPALDESVSAETDKTPGVSTQDLKHTTTKARLKDAPLSVIETEHLPESVLLTECTSKTVTGNFGQGNSFAYDKMLQQQFAADEPKAAEVSDLEPEQEADEDLEHRELTKSPILTCNIVKTENASSSDPVKANNDRGPSFVSLPTLQNEQGSVRKSLAPKKQSEKKSSTHKSGKKLKKHMTSSKPKSEGRKIKQGKESFFLNGSLESTSSSLPYLPLGQAQEELDETRSQHSLCSSSPSGSSLFSSDPTRSDSLHSRSPDDEVALISDGVTDPPDLSDKPVTPTDLIVKPLPSPKDLVESVFWASSSGTSDSGDEILEDGGEAPVEPLEILEGELGQSSELSAYDDDYNDDDDDNELAGDEMAESDDLTILTDELNNTVKDNSTATMQQLVPEESYGCNKILAITGATPGTSSMEPPLKLELNDGNINNLNEPNQEHGEGGLKQTVLSDLSDDSEIAGESIPTASSSNKPMKFVSKLHIEPFQMASVGPENEVPLSDHEPPPVVHNAKPDQSSKPVSVSPSIKTHILFNQRAPTQTESLLQDSGQSNLSDDQQSDKKIDERGATTPQTRQSQISESSEPGLVEVHQEVLPTRELLQNSCIMEDVNSAEHKPEIVEEVYHTDVTCQSKKSPEDLQHNKQLLHTEPGDTVLSEVLHAPLVSASERVTEESREEELVNTGAESKRVDDAVLSSVSRGDLTQEIDDNLQDDDNFQVLYHPCKSSYMGVEFPSTNPSSLVSSGTELTKIDPKSTITELREDMIPDGAIVEAKADESQTLILKRGKLVTEVDASMIQEELLRLRLLLNSVIEIPLAVELNEMYPKSEMASEGSVLKAGNISEGQEAQAEDSCESTTPDSSSEELSIIEQLRELSEKLGSTLSEDTSAIIERARSLSDHLEHAHSSVYSPSLVEELRELSKQLDASRFLTIEKLEERALSADHKNQDDDEKTMSFQSAQDLTLYQTAFEVTQKNVQPTPLGNLSLDPTPMQSTPVPYDSDPLELAGVEIRSPVMSPLTWQSSSSSLEYTSKDDLVFLDESETRKSTPDLNQLQDMKSESSNGSESPADDGAIDTAERVMSEMTSFRLHLDILSGSDTVDDDDESDDDNSSEGSYEDPVRVTEGDNEDENHDTDEIPRKMRPPLSSRSSFECSLPAISEECLSTSDMDESERQPAVVSPTGNVENIGTPYNEDIENVDSHEKVGLDDATRAKHSNIEISCGMKAGTIVSPSTSHMTHNGKIYHHQSEPANQTKFLRAVVRNSPEEEQNVAESLEGSSHEGKCAQSSPCETPQSVVAEGLQPFIGKEFAATKAKLNMLVRVLGGNWESLGETSSEGSGASSPVQAALCTTPREEMPPADDEANLETIYGRLNGYDSGEESEQVYTYDESAQTDWLTEEELTTLTVAAPEEIPPETGQESDSSSVGIQPLSGVLLVSAFTQTTLSQRVEPCSGPDLLPAPQQRMRAALLPVLTPEAHSSSLPVPQHQLSSDEDDDFPAYHPSSSHHIIPHDDDQIHPNHLPKHTLSRGFLENKLLPLDSVGSASVNTIALQSAGGEFDREIEIVDEPGREEDSCQQKQAPEDIRLPIKEPILTKTAVMLSEKVINFPHDKETKPIQPCRPTAEENPNPIGTANDEHSSNQLGCFEFHEVNPSGRSKPPNWDNPKIDERTSPGVNVPIELVRKTTVAPKEFHFLWPSQLGSHLSLGELLTESVKGTKLEVYDADIKSCNDAGGNPTDQEETPKMEIPEICTPGPVEEPLVKEALTLNDKPIMWPLSRENPKEKYNKYSCDPSGTNSLFQPIREESNSAQSTASNQNPSAENLLTPDESVKAPEQLQIPAEYIEGDANLNDLKQLSTAMGLSPQRSYSTDEELIQIFSKGVAHFRNLKQDIVKPTLVAVATNTSPVKTGLDQWADRVDAAVMTDSAIEKSHVYTSMSPDTLQDPCLNETSEIIPESVAALSQLTAAQLLSRIVDNKPNTWTPEQMSPSDNDDAVCAQDELSESHQREAESGTDHGPVLDRAEEEQQIMNPASVNPAVSHSVQSELSNKAQSLEDLETQQPSKMQVFPTSKEVSRSQETTTGPITTHLSCPAGNAPVQQQPESSTQDLPILENDAQFDEEEQRLLKELRKRTLASQQAAKRAMACALRLRQRNLSDNPDEAAGFERPSSVQGSETKTTLTGADAFGKAQDGETKRPDQVSVELVAREKPESHTTADNGGNVSVAATLHPVSEIVNQECMFNDQPWQEFAKNVARLTRKSSSDLTVQSSKMALDVTSEWPVLSLNDDDSLGMEVSSSSSPLHLDGADSADSILKQEDGRLNVSEDSHQPKLLPAEERHDEMYQSGPLAPLINENIQRQAVCDVDSNQLTSRLARLRFLGLAAEPSQSRVTSDDEEKQTVLPDSMKVLAQPHGTDLPSVKESSECSSQETEADDIHSKLFDKEILKNRHCVDAVEELLFPSELVRENVHRSPASEDLEKKLAKLTEKADAQNVTREKIEEIETNKNIEDSHSNTDTDTLVKQDDHHQRDGHKRRRPLLSTFSDISFDLDNNDDEDLRALKETNENIDRVIAETSSVESDLEDDSEPELAGLVDDDTDNFAPLGSLAEGMASSMSNPREQPQKAASAPADLIPRKPEVEIRKMEDAEKTKEEEEEEEEDISSLRLRGILVSPDKLEWLLADSESEGSTSSSPKEREDSPGVPDASVIQPTDKVQSDDDGMQVAKGIPTENENRQLPSGAPLNTELVAEEKHAQEQPKNSNMDENFNRSPTDSSETDIQKQYKLSGLFKYETPAVKEGRSLPEPKSVFGSAKGDRMPLTQTWPLMKSKEEILKNSNQDKSERSGNLQAQPLVSHQEHVKEPTSIQDNISDASGGTPDLVNDSLTQSSGVFSASTRDTELPWLRERRLSSERISSTGSETEDADMRKIHQEYQNILEDSPEPETELQPSTQTMPTNAFTQTDEESPSSGSILQDNCLEMDQELPWGTTRLNASWPYRESIPGVSTKLDPRRDIAVELMEASLMHGIGETDAFLKFLDSDLPLEEWKSPQMMMRHRRSKSAGTPLTLYEELHRHDPSPSKHKPRQKTDTVSQPASLTSEASSQDISRSSPSETPADSPTSLSPSPSALPSERRKFLQRLRSKIVSATSSHRPERAKIDALLQDSWMGKISPRTTGLESQRKPHDHKAPSPNSDDIEALLEESRHMREKSRAEIEKAEQNLSHQRPLLRTERDAVGTLSASQRYPSFKEGSDELFSPSSYSSPASDHAVGLSGRPKSADSLLRGGLSVLPPGGLEHHADGHRRTADVSARHSRPQSAHGSLDMYNCKDAIDREIECLRAASAAMSSRTPTLTSSDIPSWRTQLHTQAQTWPSPPPPQRYAPSFDQDTSHHLTPRNQLFGEGTARHSQSTTPYSRPQHPLIIPIIALHPPSSEEIDPSSIPIIAHANEVLEASYRKSRGPSPQVQDTTASWSPLASTLDSSVQSPGRAEGGDSPDVSRSQPSYSSRSGRPSPHVQDRISQSASLPPKRRHRADSPDASTSKGASNSPPRRSGRQIRRSSLERTTRELPPIIETPLVSWDTLYHLAADQAMAYLIRETTLTGNVDPCKTQQPGQLSGWRYLGAEKDIVLWQKINIYCPIDSFLGISVLRAPASTVFSLIHNSAKYDCLHKSIEHVKVIHKVDRLMVAHILCRTDQCSLQQPRDFCCVIKETKKSGRWYIVATSVKHSECPVDPSTVRGQILCCGVAMEPISTTDGEHCRISYILQMDLQGDLKPTLANRLTSRLPLCLAHLRDCVEIGQL